MRLDWSVPRTPYDHWMASCHGKSWFHMIMLRAFSHSLGFYFAIEEVG